MLRPGPAPPGCLSSQCPADPPPRKHNWTYCSIGQGHCQVVTEDSEVPHRWSAAHRDLFHDPVMTWFLSWQWRRKHVILLRIIFEIFVEPPSLMLLPSDRQIS